MVMTFGPCGPTLSLGCDRTRIIDLTNEITSFTIVNENSPS
jgi:hypothetical protein